MSRAVIVEKFGGPEVLEFRDVTEPHAQAGEVRVKVTSVSLNPMDPGLALRPEAAEMFGLSLPSGFGSDFAGVIDEVGEGVTEYKVGDRVFGGAIGRAAADYVVTKPGSRLWHTPDNISDEVASTLPVAGLTAIAALDAINLQKGDAVLIGGAAGGVGVFAVQLAKLAGARVIGTASENTFSFLKSLGAEPVTYGEGLADRVRKISPDGITAAADLFGTEVAETALELGVPPERISTIAARANVSVKVQATGARNANPKDMQKITDAIESDKLVVPIEARFPIEEIQKAVELLSARHTHGKIVIAL